MKKLLLLMITILNFCNNAKSSALLIAEDSLAIKLDVLLKRYDSRDKPGLTVGIIDNGKLVFKKGYGLANTDTKLPNSAEVIYKVASVSKQFTAACILRLIQMQKLSLQDEIHQYIPGLPDYGHSITISDLLYHTSGIRDYMVLMWLCGKGFEEAFSNDEALAVILRQKELNFVPRKRCVYSNSNYVLLAEIIKQVSGQSLAEFAKRELFKPMAMHDSQFDDRADKKYVKKAVSYMSANDGYLSYRNNNLVIGDGGLSTTLNDLLKWDAAFYDSTSLNHQLLTPGKLDNGNSLSYGMGIMTGRYRSYAVQKHAGAFLGYRAELLRFPERKISIICLGNTEEIHPETIASQIADIYLSHEIKILNNDTQPVYELTSVQAVTGKYEIGPGVFIDIKHENGLLTGQATGQPKHILYPRSNSTYRIGDTGDSVVFNSNDEGMITELTIIQKQGRTGAQKLTLVSRNLVDFTGRYRNAEQNATYSFFIDGNSLWFKVGENLKERCEIFEKYDRIQFGYKNLETATIDFERNDEGQIVGFTLSSGRIAGLKFSRE